MLWAELPHLSLMYEPFKPFLLIKKPDLRGQLHVDHCLCKDSIELYFMWKMGGIKLSSYRVDLPDCLQLLARTSPKSRARQSRPT